MYDANGSVTSTPTARRHPPPPVADRTITNAGGGGETYEYDAAVLSSAATATRTTQPPQTLALMEYDNPTMAICGLGPDEHSILNLLSQQQLAMVALAPRPVQVRGSELGLGLGSVLGLGLGSVFARGVAFDSRRVLGGAMRPRRLTRLRRKRGYY
jgi:hypothetical protein